MAPPVLYLFWRLFVSGRQYFYGSKWIKGILPAVLCTFYLFPAAAGIDFYLSGHVDVLKYPKPMVYWFWFGLVFVFQLASWVIIADLVKLMGRLTGSDRNRITYLHPRAVLILFILVFCYTGWKVYSDTAKVTVEKVSVAVENLPESFQGLKIAHISDIQGDEYTGREKIAGYVKKLNEQKPDLVIFTGDLISYGTDFIRMSAEELGRAQAAQGVYAVVGDHDYWAGAGEVGEALKEADIPLLRDENRIIPIRDSLSVALTGVTEVYSKSSNPRTVDSLSSSAGDADLKIFASHQVNAQLIASAKAHDFAMMLAGHTHGGQIRVPFMGMEFSASERETRYVSGLYLEGDLPVIVNNGLGFTLGPIRYNAPAAITVIELQPK